MTDPRNLDAAAAGGSAPLTAAPILRRSLRDGAIFAALVAVIGGVIGYLIAGVPGLIGALLGAAVAAVFLGLTAVTMLVAGKAVHGDLTSPLFYGIIVGSWVLKLILFVVLVLWLRSQTWFDARVFFVTTIIAVVGSLVLDGVAFARSRVPYVSDLTLPHQDAGSGTQPPAADDDGTRS